MTKIDILLEECAKILQEAVTEDVTRYFSKDTSDKIHEVKDLINRIDMRVDKWKHKTEETIC